VSLLLLLLAGVSTAAVPAASAASAPPSAATTGTPAASASAPASPPTTPTATATASPPASAPPPPSSSPQPPKASAPAPSPTSAEPKPAVTGQATRAANTDVCNIYCDTRDPSLAAATRQGATVGVSGRTITLYFDDPDDMAWGAITGGAAGDTVWLDRSFDGGQTWASGSQLGDTGIPSGDTGWRTLMYNVDNPSAYGVGAVRACGEATSVSTTIVCTPWLRSTTHAGTPAAASITALMQYYDPSTGSWDSTLGWQDSQALTTLVDYMQLTGDSTYAYALSQIYSDNDASQFTDNYLDDTGWWGLAWLRAYQYTGDPAYLQTAEWDDDYMSAYWSGSCGGGLWWSTSETNINAVENEVYLELSAALHNTLTGDTTYLDRANQEWSWFADSGLINSRDLVNDGLNLSTCQNNGAPTYTYNQGTILAGLAQLSQATGNTSVLTTAQSIATAATTDLVTNGILVDPCEPNGCASDGYSFKGIFERGLGEYVQATGTTAYNSFLSAQASAILAHDTDGDGQSGLAWAGPIEDLGFPNQQSAADAFNADLVPPGSSPEIASIAPAPAVAGRQVTVTGTGFGSSQGAGYAAFGDDGTDWGAPGNAATFTVDAWSNTSVTFTVPSPSGTNGAWAVTAGSVATVRIVNASGQSSNTGTLAIAPAGPIVAGVSSSLCVDDRSASTADYNPIQIYTCNNTGAQQWTVASGDTLQVLGLCMDVDAAGTADGTLVDLYPCNGTGAQVWVPQADGSLLNPNSGKCLDDPASSTTAGTQLEIWDCNSGSNQKWTLP
jgi:Glycosyl hydrolase family 76/Ricin-type beta-trefoil lectin domain/IPT/TIG domain